jgi:PAS domain-containing protein
MGDIAAAAPGIELVMTSEGRAPNDIIWPPGGKEPIEAVIVTQSWLLSSGPAVISEILNANDGLCLVVEAAQIDHVSDYIVSDRVMAVPEDHARALQLAAALAQSCRLERSQAQIKMELRAAQRAAQLVSTEYQRQQRDRDKLFEIALNNMSQGLCMFDAHHRLVTCNRRYAEMYGLGPEATRSGVSYSDIVAARLASGNLPVGVESIVTNLQYDIALPDACTIEKLADGRVVSVNRQSMSDRGWVEIHQDITAQ